MHNYDIVEIVLKNKIVFQSFLSLILPKLIKNLNNYKSEKHQSQIILTKILYFLQTNLILVKQGTIIKNPSQK